jgi:glycosyltransferase involved in cell wall biosynthesis
MSDSMGRCGISVVVPVYGCAGCLVALHARLAGVLGSEDWEVVFVDDCSPDGAWTRLEELSDGDERIRALRLSRNFGQHAAITAGLAEARGDWVVVMDCDLQDPPEEIPRLLATAREGYDVVLTQRDRRRQSWHRRLASKAYFRMRNALMGTSMISEYATLSVISRNVVDAFLSLGDVDRQYMLILHWLGFRRTVLPLRQGDRHEGKSSYTLSKLIQVAVDGLFFQTTRLLRWIVLLGFLVAGAGAVLAAAFIVLYFTAKPLPGFTGLAVLTLLVGGFILVSTGIIGLYVGKIFEQVKGRPLYVVERRTRPVEAGMRITESRDKSSLPS